MNAQVIAPVGPDRPAGWRRSSARQAFTLVELLVVITIIGILVALLIPAVGIVIKNAKEAQIGIEVASLAQAIEAYKLEQGSYPPDFGLPPDSDLADLNAHMARNSRYRNKNEVALTDMTLDPAEALVFWLSGLSADPKFPLARRDTITTSTGLTSKPLKGNKPFFEFDQGRLGDEDEDGWPEYYPENGEAPYVYLQNYGLEDTTNGLFKASSRIILRGTPKQQEVRAYAAELVGKGVKRFVDHDKFQIICAGLDNKFGAGSNLDRGISPTYPDGLGYQKIDEDNLTSFSEGKTLQAAMP